MPKLEIEVKDDKYWKALCRLSSDLQKPCSEIIQEMVQDSIMVKYIPYIVKEIKGLDKTLPEYKEVL